MWLAFQNDRWSLSHRNQRWKNQLHHATVHHLTYGCIHASTHKLPAARAGSLPRAKYIWILNYSSGGVPSVSLEVCELTEQTSPTVLTVLPSQMTNFLWFHHPC